MTKRRTKLSHPAIDNAAGLAAAPGSTACFACHRNTTGEITWTGESGEEICQECWEVECSRSWWKMVAQLDKLGLLEAPYGLGSSWNNRQRQAQRPGRDM